MPILESAFDREAELEAWLFANITQFLGDSVTLPKFQVTTSSGKNCIPDAFVFNFVTREWYLVECELLQHGVWPHIAEQITRFVVALQNPDTLRKIRDRLFEYVLSSGKSEVVAGHFDAGVERLLQQIELFVEGVQPTVVIFIDDTNQDLNDFAHALDVPTRIYRVKKFLVNGRAEYYSPDQTTPAITTTPEDKAHGGSQDLDVIESVGGGALLTDQGRAKCYKLNDGRIIHIKRSKYHERNQYYWYGINPGPLEQVRGSGGTHIVFVMGNWGFAVVPIEVVTEYCQHTKASKNPDGSVRHYHVLISPEPDPVMYWSNDVPKYDLTPYCQSFG